jgi:hypothetical protein
MTASAPNTTLVLMASSFMRQDRKQFGASLILSSMNRRRHQLDHRTFSPSCIH